MTRAPRWAASVVLVGVAVVLLLLTAVAQWTQSTVVDGDAFQASVAPIVNDPAVQQQLTDEATTRAMAALTQAVQDQAGFLAPVLTPLVPQLEPTVRAAVAKTVASPQVAAAWSVTSRQVHDDLLASLRGSDVGGVSTSTNSITLDLNSLKAPIVDSLSGSKLASLALDRLSLGTVTVPLDVQRLRRAVQINDHVGWWTPLLALLALVAALALAPRRPVVLLLAGAALVAAAGLTMVGYTRQVVVGSGTLDATGALIAQAVTSALDEVLVRNLLVLGAFGVGLGLAGALWLVLGSGSRRAAEAVTAPGVGSAG